MEAYLRLEVAVRLARHGRTANWLDLAELSLRRVRLKNAIARAMRASSGMGRASRPVAL
jgi:hypothetical protein